MNKAIVITSIFAPSEAIHRFSALPGWRLYVAGDRKSPERWSAENVEYLSIDAQEAMACRTVRHLPYNHYGRKMIGYLRAIDAGAQVIAESDDDNVPYAGWSFPDFESEFPTTASGLGFVNVYRRFTSQHIWPRGYPLDLILDRSRNVLPDAGQTQSARVGIWQGLADGDPDVDAIYRLTNNTPCTFDKHAPIVLAEGTYCPFNSQNTAFARPLFPLLYLPSFVTFRFTDILRGLVAQPILQAAGFRLGFTEATVVQERNPHDYMKDFVSEIPCFLHPYRVIEETAGAISSGSSVSQNLLAAYERLVAAGIVPATELPLLHAWIEDIDERLAAPGLSS